MRVFQPADFILPIRTVVGFWISSPLLPFLTLCCLAVLPNAHAQSRDEIETIERLYAAAAYEETLSLIDQLEPVLSADTRSIAEIRILCMLALGQSERAQIAIEKLIEQNPRYQPDPVRFSPARREQFETLRRRVLPRIIERKYAEAKTSFVAKHYGDAVREFELLLDLLNELENESRLAEVRTLASGFLEVAKHAVGTAQAPVGTSGSASTDERIANMEREKRRDFSAPKNDESSRRLQNTASRPAGHATIYDPSATDVVPPAALTPILPPASVAPSGVTQKSGLFEIIVDESGRVESVSVRRSIHAEFDAGVQNESRNWRFRPAMRDGRPVKFRKLIEVYSVPLASIRQ